LNVPKLTDFGGRPRLGGFVQNDRMIAFRPATSDDLPDIHRIWWAADPWDAFNDNPWFGHVLRTGSMMVATIDARLVGFAGVRQVAGTTVVSDCFVDPDHQGQGVGTRLLSRLVPGDRPLMTLASSDPKAGALYARFGMEAKWDCHYLEGDPARVDRGEATVKEVSGYPVDEPDLSHLRDDLHCRFLDVGGGRAAVAADDIESSVVPLAGDPIGVLTAVLAWTADRGDRRMNLHLSDRHPVFPLLIEAGFVVKDADTLMASPGAGVPDPARITFNGDILRPDGC
jgi:GNAT superfamily N-acetyltransferase